MASFSAPQAGERIILQQQFSFSPYPDARQQKVNEILQILADGSGKLRVFTSFTMHVELGLELSHQAGEVTMAKVFIQDVSVSGDTSYKDFSVSHLLLPGHADLEIALLLDDGRVLEKKRLQGVKLSMGDDPWLTFSLQTGSASPGQRLEVKAFSFYFGDTAFARFERWGQGVEAYYGTSEYLREVRTLLEGLQPVAASDIVTNEFRLCQAERIIGRIAHGEFHHWLQLEEGDPLALLDSLDVLDNELYDLRQSYNHYLEELDSMLHALGMAILKEESYARARPVFQSALNYNPFHIPSQLALIRADYSEGQYETALESLAQVHYKMFPSDREKGIMTSLADSLFGHFFALADSLALEGRHVQALQGLQHVVSYCERTRGRDECPGALRPMLAKSHYGIYQSFLTVASRALQDDRPDLAAIYVKNALDYQQEYLEFIGDAAEAKSLLYRLLRPAIHPVIPPR